MMTTVVFLFIFLLYILFGKVFYWMLKGFEKPKSFQVYAAFLVFWPVYILVYIVKGK